MRESRPHVGDCDSESLRDGRHRDDNSSAEPDGLELAGADELVGGRAADAEEEAGLGDGEYEGSGVGVHALLGLLRGQNLTRVVEKSVQSDAGTLRELASRPQVPRRGTCKGVFCWRGASGRRESAGSGKSVALRGVVADGVADESGDGLGGLLVGGGEGVAVDVQRRGLVAMAEASADRRDWRA